MSFFEDFWNRASLTVTSWNYPKTLKIVIFWFFWQILAFFFEKSEIFFEKFFFFNFFGNFCYFLKKWKISEIERP